MINLLNVRVYFTVIFLRMPQKKLKLLREKVYMLENFILILSIALQSNNFVVVLLLHVHGKHVRLCRDGQLTLPLLSWAGLDLLCGKPKLRAHTFASN